MNGVIDTIPGETPVDRGEGLVSLVFDAGTRRLLLVVRCHPGLVDTEKRQLEQEDWYEIAEAASHLLTAIRHRCFEGRDAEPPCSFCGAAMARFAGPGAERGWTCVRCDDQEPAMA